MQALVRERGSDCWWELSEEDLLPPSLRPQASLYTKGSDTLDVWFDSGCSWSHNLTHPLGTADLYLEGSDQHRGWFQSSLLTRMGVGEESAPYRAIVTHGFLVDEHGDKMSKSVGNVLSPADLIGDIDETAERKNGEGGGNVDDDTIKMSMKEDDDHQDENDADDERKKKKKKKEKKKEKQKQGGGRERYGADVLRLWVASSDWRGDVAVGPTVLSKTRETHRRLRNACRFMLGNLSDFDPTSHAVPLNQLSLVDRYMLHRLAEYCSEVSLWNGREGGGGNWEGQPALTEKGLLSWARLLG